MLGSKSLFKLIPGILIVRADKQLNMKGAFKMTKPSKAVEKIEHLLADPWAVDIQKFGEQEVHNPDKRKLFNALHTYLLEKRQDLIINVKHFVV